MASNTLGDVIRRLGRLSGLQSDLAQTDAQLLERFARRRDEPAFAALMVRHGPMVFSILYDTSKTNHPKCRKSMDRNEKKDLPPYSGRGGSK